MMDKFKSTMKNLFTAEMEITGIKANKRNTMYNAIKEKNIIINDKKNDNKSLKSVKQFIYANCTCITLF